MDHPKSFPRLFTVDEANALLASLCPLMERIFHSLELLKICSETVIRQEGLGPDSPDLLERLKGNDAVVDAMQQIQQLVEEVNRFGCISKGVEQGLVDFPCLLGGETVFLCWRYGEESVSHWHRIQDGFAGRRPLLDLDENNGSSFH